MLNKVKAERRGKETSQEGGPAKLYRGHKKEERKEVSEVISKKERKEMREGGSL